MSEVLKTKGDCIRVKDVELRGDKEFPVQIFVLRLGDVNYPQDVAFELAGKKAGTINEDLVGKILEVSFDLRGREYEGRYYTNLQAWRVDVVGEVEPAPQETENDETDEDLLPF